MAEKQNHSTQEENGQDVTNPSDYGKTGRNLDLPSSRAVPQSIDLDSRLNTLTGLGLIVLFLFFGILGFWAYTAPIASAAIASGKVVYEGGTRQRISHEAGGQIERIPVRIRDYVRAGDILVEFSMRDARTRYQQTRIDYAAAIARWDRLESEQKREARPRFRETLLQIDEPEIQSIISSEQDLFYQRRESFESRSGILNQRIAQLNQQIRGLRDQISAQNRQISYINEEIEGVRELVERGLERRPRLLGLERNKTQIEGDRAANQAAIARAEEAILETRTQLTNLVDESQEQIAGELRDVRARAAQLEQQLLNAYEVLNTTTLRSPMAARVEMIAFHQGQAVPAGAVIMELVPSDGEPRIETRINPIDIEAVKPGLEARIQFLGSSGRNTPDIFGTVQSVGMDSMQDEVTGRDYYLATILVPDEELKKLNLQTPTGWPVPGTPATVFINTGERTLFQFIAKPITDSFDRSFRQN